MWQHVCAIDNACTCGSVLRIRMRDVNDMNTPSNPITWIHNGNTAQITHVIMSTAPRIDQSDGDRCA